MSLIHRLRARSRSRSEAGNALVLALLFLTVCGVTIGGLLTYSSATSTSTTAVRVARGNDYDAVAAMNAAIANVRIGNTCGTGNTGYTPSWTLNNTDRPLRVDCFSISSTSALRQDVFLVCLSSVSAPCPDNSALLKSEVTFYDSQGTGKSLQVETWSNE
jgi:hypothetical protein